MKKNALIVVTLSIALIMIGAGLISLHYNFFSPTNERTKMFYLKAERFKWTFYDQNKKELGSSIVLNIGDKVILKVYSIDVAHGLWIDGYSERKIQVEYPDWYPDSFKNSLGSKTGKVLLIKNPLTNDPFSMDLVMVTFIADTPGRFTLRCAVTCGSFHPYMLGQIKIRPHAVLYLALGSAAIVGALGIIIGYRKYLQLEKTHQQKAK